MGKKGKERRKLYFPNVWLFNKLGKGGGGNYLRNNKLLICLNEFRTFMHSIFAEKCMYFVPIIRLNYASTVEDSGISDLEPVFKKGRIRIQTKSEQPDFFWSSFLKYRSFFSRRSRFQILWISTRIRNSVRRCIGCQLWGENWNIRG